MERDALMPTHDGDIPCYLAHPDGAGPFPAILVVQEIFGLNPHIKDIVRRFAAQGYFAIAAELYARQGDVVAMSDMQAIREVVARVPDAQVMADLDASVAFAEGTGRADVGRLGITGFCWGGRIVWTYAAHRQGLAAGVAWYGRLAGQTTELQPAYPIDLVGRIAAPVLGLYGGQDQSIPVSDVRRMEEALGRAGKTCEIVVYDDAPHAFFADYRPSYRETPAEDGWTRCLAWFERYLGAS